MNLHNLGEFGLINRCRARLAQRAGVLFGIGDDAAVLSGIASPVVTCDCLIERVHFRRDWTAPRQLGHKAISVNVSDIAAMGGRPIAAFIALALGPHDDLAFVDELYAGFEEAAALHDLTVAGGDTSRSLADLMINVTLIGDAPRPILRSGAHPGDIVLVTGSLGDAAAGLSLLQKQFGKSPPLDKPGAPWAAVRVGSEGAQPASKTPSPAPPLIKGKGVLPAFQTASQNPVAGISDASREYLLQRHHDPTARLPEMQAALSSVSDSSLVHAAIDISDGLLGDAGHIAEASAVSIEVELARLPVAEPCHEAARAMDCEVWDWVLHGGEDYELLLCVAPAVAPLVVEAITTATGTAVTEIGRCVERATEPVTLIQRDGRRTVAPAISFTHF